MSLRARATSVAISRYVVTSRAIWHGPYSLFVVNYSSFLPFPLDKRFFRLYICLVPAVLRIVVSALDSLNTTIAVHSSAISVRVDCFSAIFPSRRRFFFRFPVFPFRSCLPFSDVFTSSGCVMDIWSDRCSIARLMRWGRQPRN